MKPLSFTIPGILLLIFSYVAKSQDLGYTWPLPERWVKEIIPFPLKFAQELDYPGVEEIHFLPGWRGDTLQDQQWSYIFVWKLDTVFNPGIVQIKNDLITYFNGLTKWVIKNSKACIKYQPVSFIRIDSCSGSEHSCFSGRITFLDVFFTLSPVTLNFRILSSVHKETETSIIFFLLSPKSHEHEIWKTLQDHISDFVLIRNN